MNNRYCKDLRKQPEDPYRPFNIVRKEKADKLARKNSSRGTVNREKNNLFQDFLTQLRNWTVKVQYGIPRQQVRHLNGLAWIGGKVIKNCSQSTFNRTCSWGLGKFVNYSKFLKYSLMGLLSGMGWRRRRYFVSGSEITSKRERTTSLLFDLSIFPTLMGMR